MSQELITLKYKYGSLLNRCQDQDETALWWRKQADELRSQLEVEKDKSMRYRVKSERWQKRTEDRETELFEAHEKQAECEAQQQQALAEIENERLQLNKQTDDLRALEDKFEEQCLFYDHNVILLKKVSKELEEQKALAVSLHMKLETQKQHNLKLLQDRQLIVRYKEDCDTLRKEMPRLAKWGRAVESVYKTDQNVRMITVDGVKYDVNDIMCKLSDDKLVKLRTIIMAIILAGIQRLVEPLQSLSTITE